MLTIATERSKHWFNPKLKMLRHIHLSRVREWVRMYQRKKTLRSQDSHRDPSWRMHFHRQVGGYDTVKLQLKDYIKILVLSNEQV